MVSPTQGLHRKEKKYVINKGLQKTPLCLYDSDSLLEILYYIPLHYAIFVYSLLLCVKYSSYAK